jgi:hypothetical protein
LVSVVGRDAADRVSLCRVFEGKSLFSVLPRTYTVTGAERKAVLQQSAVGRAYSSKKQVSPQRLRRPTLRLTPAFHIKFEKPAKVVVRYLSGDMSAEDISKAVAALYFGVISVQQLTANRPLPDFSLFEFIVMLYFNPSS